MIFPSCTLLQIVRDNLHRKRKAMIRIASIYRGYRGRLRAREAAKVALMKYVTDVTNEMQTNISEGGTTRHSSCDFPFLLAHPVGVHWKYAVSLQ